MNEVISFLNSFEDILWSYVGIYFVLFAGLYFTVRSKGFQFRAIGSSVSVLKQLHGIAKDKDALGISPFRLYFASVGGMIGLGNIVVVVTAVTAGGPGALFWILLAAFVGMLIKYSEIYLGVKFRQKNDQGGYDGGPMFFLRKAFNNKVLPIVSCVLLCIYGAEVSQFKIITDTVSQTFDISWFLVAVVLASLVLYSVLGGIKRVANICTILMPFFMLLYVLMCFWIILKNIHILPDTLLVVFKSAFVGHAPVAGFAGSTALAAMHFGVARAVYSGDIGVGYDSIVQSETKSVHPEPQAKLALFGQLTDVTICTCTILVVLLTGTWCDPSIKDSSGYIIKSLSMYFPYIDVFMSILFFLAGYTTIIAYFAVGTKCANFLYPKIGKKIYVVYGMAAFLLTKYTNQESLIVIMSISSGLLLLMNVSAIIKLRKFINFK